MMDETINNAEETATTADDQKQIEDFTAIRDEVSTGRARFQNFSTHSTAQLPEDLHAFKNESDAPLSEVYDATPNASRDSAPLLAPSERNPITAAPLSANPGNASAPWSPNWFNIKAVNHTNNYRGGWLQFAWDSTRMASLKKDSNVTFEPDFVTYNYDGRHYFSKGSSSITSWNTTMPCGYKDTSFSDNPNELVYTIGCNDAQKLSADKKYVTHFVADPGNSTRDTMKIAAQRGSRKPSICYSTWCIFVGPTSERYPRTGAQWHPVTTREARFFVGNSTTYWIG